MPAPYTIYNLVITLKNGTVVSLGEYGGGLNTVPFYNRKHAEEYAAEIRTRRTVESVHVVLAVDAGSGII